jgi:hypothetical protein
LGHGEKSKELIDLKKRFEKKRRNFYPAYHLGENFRMGTEKIDQEEIPEINQDIGLQFSVEA